MPKTKIRILKEFPILCGITKNGRSVGDISARSALEKIFPDIQLDDWKIESSDHESFAFRKSQHTINCISAISKDNNCQNQCNDRSELYLYWTLPLLTAKVISDYVSVHICPVAATIDGWIDFLKQKNLYSDKVHEEMFLFYMAHK